MSKMTPPPHAREPTSSDRSAPEYKGPDPWPPDKQFRRALSAPEHPIGSVEAPNKIPTGHLASRTPISGGRCIQKAPDVWKWCSCKVCPGVSWGRVSVGAGLTEELRWSRGAGESFCGLLSMHRRRAREVEGDQSPI